MGSIPTLPISDYSWFADFPRQLRAHTNNSTCRLVVARNFRELNLYAKSSRDSSIGLVCFLAAALIAVGLQAKIKLPGVISDHMVLQQGIPVPHLGNGR